MDEMTDPALKRDRPPVYGQPPPHDSMHHRGMQPAETVPLHGYPPQHSGAAMPPHWNPPPPPSSYSDNSDHRPISQDVPPHQVSYPHSYPPPPPPPQQQHPPPHPSHPARDPGPYGAEPSYSRHGSFSGPNRSPAEGQHGFPSRPVNGSQDPSYYGPPPPEYRQHNAYGAPDSQSNGTHQPLHVVTGPEMMSGQPPGVPPHPGHYGPPSAGPPPTPGGYYFDPYGSGQRRKPVRAAQACDSCRQRKAKCDEGRPECQHCKDNSLKCTYREIPPQKAEKQALAINEKLESMGDDIRQLMQVFKSQDEKINRLLDTRQSSAPAPATSTSTVSSPDLQRSQAKEIPRPPLKSRTSAPSFKREDSQVYTHPNQSFTSGEVERIAENSNELVETLPIKHTTAASNLLSWPSIQALIPKEMKTSYVMDTESERGLLRLYGCGEGEDRGDGHEGAPSPSNSSSSEGRRMDEDVQSSASPHGVWGSGQLPAPPTSTQSHTARDHAGGVSPHGGLMLDSEAVDRYFRGYMDNMHILHPFLEPKVIRNMMLVFKRKYSWDYRATQQRVGTISNKRKREMTDSPVSMDDHGTLPSHQSGRTSGRNVHSVVLPIEHSVANAIVLLVLALGKICLHKDQIPGAVSTSTIRTSQPHNLYSDLPLSISAPNSPFNNQASLAGNMTMAMSSPANPQGKNMDAIPGLAYFAKAADILGELPGGVDVSHIQANLLAGLYMGQLARIFPSHYYISNACKACQILIESTAYTNNQIKPARRNLINFAFWSCLQLESDILAEVELPPSGITRYEGRQHNQMPTGVTLDPIPEAEDQHDLLRFYSYQIQLRRTMNSVHSSLYQAKRSNLTRPSLTVIDILDKNLDAWRAMLNDWDWDDNDHQSDNINVARMRAKYYGAKYIIHRPVLHYVLSLCMPPIDTDSPRGGPGWSSEIPSPSIAYSQAPGNKTHRPGTMGPPNKTSLFEIEEPMLVASKTCVEAAVRSTTAFDKVPRRLIITNIFGTAHAQFGNVLVLAATLTSPHPMLSSLIDRNTVRKLLDRTITFLQEHQRISPVLGKDVQILQHVKATIFHNYSGGSATSSFSSSR